MRHSKVMFWKNNRLTEDRGSSLHLLSKDCSRSHVPRASELVTKLSRNTSAYKQAVTVPVRQRCELVRQRGKYAKEPFLAPPKLLTFLLLCIGVTDLGEVYST